jgi:signal peptidase I
MTPEKKPRNRFSEFLKNMAWAGATALLAHTFVFQASWIPSGSMKETLIINDYLIVNKMAYGYSSASCPNLGIPALGLGLKDKTWCGMFDREDGRIWGASPERGDVVVFRHPVTGVDYIKRAIGLPGDTIQMQDGVLSINGKPVERREAGVFEEPAVGQGAGQICENAPVENGETCRKTRHIETLPNGVSYVTLDAGDRQSDNTGIYTVPAGHFFFMGDNRDNSADSRLRQAYGGVGFVPFKDLIGRADRILLSAEGSSLLQFWTWRSDRFYKSVQDTDL